MTKYLRVKELILLQIITWQCFILNESHGEENVVGNGKTEINQKILFLNHSNYEFKDFLFKETNETGYEERLNFTSIFPLTKNINFTPTEINYKDDQKQTNATVQNSSELVKSQTEYKEENLARQNLTGFVTDPNEFAIFVEPQNESNSEKLIREESKCLLETQLLCDEERDKNVYNNKDISIRKCCNISEFFSSLTENCEAMTSDSGYSSKFSTLITNIQNRSIIYLVGPVKNCIEGDGFPMIKPISNETHFINREGEVIEREFDKNYNQSQYCLEMIGEYPTNSQLNLVFCPKDNDYNYYYDSEDYSMYETELTVKKCCPENQYYNIDVHKCVPLVAENVETFSEAVQSLSFENGNTKVIILPSHLKKCPGDLEELDTLVIDGNSYRIRYNGLLIHISTGKQYDSSQYCLEQVGNMKGIKLTLVYCNTLNNTIPKCCPSSHYFNNELFECLPIAGDFKGIKKKLLNTFRINSEKFTLKPLTYLLSCKNTFPSEETKENVFFNGVEMCVKGSCYNNKDYCIDFAGTGHAKSLQPVSFFCHTEFFVKCCPVDQILDVNGCRKSSNMSSFLLKHLLKTRKAVSAFDYRNCENEATVLLEESLSSYVQWWLSRNGQNIIVESDSETNQINHYCIDDFLTTNNILEPSAFVCRNTVKNMIPDHIQLKSYLEEDNIGKCCPLDKDDGIIHYFAPEEQECRILSIDTVKNNSFLNKATIINTYFRNFPECSKTSTGYHSYPFSKTNIDHAVLNPDGSLKIISMDGQCVSKEEKVNNSRFCYEYQLIDGNLEPFAFVCAREIILEVYQEKFGFVSTLLGISCVFLFATLVFLFTVKVKRGIVYTKKVHTLAGKILVSFVGSHFFGFVALSLTQHDNALNRSGTIWCHILAGFIQFFNLATFCWNTSICLESLLLTIHIRISEWLRYFLHSLWAWGFPLFMTVLMLLMDKYKEDLPCGTITPDIGDQHCFHSGDDARLLYFYLPVFVTLTANVLFLFGAKALRRSRLQRLEMAPKRPFPTDKKDKATIKENQTPSSGMRTHQIQNTKAESLRIVLWTGGTWFLELAGFVVTRYILPHNTEKWYDYLWYLPTSINALRGVGIFAIVVLTPEVRKNLKNRFSSFIRYVTSKPTTGLRSTVEEPKRDICNTSQSHNWKHLSINTVLSSISNSLQNSRMAGSRENSEGTSSRSISAESALNESPSHILARRFAMIRSVSEIEQQSLGSSIGAIDTEMELDLNLQKLEVSIEINNSTAGNSIPEDEHRAETM